MGNNLALRRLAKQQEELELLKEKYDELLEFEDPVVTCNALKRIWYAGLFGWIMIPLQFTIALLFSTCKGGAPWWVYLMPLAIILFNKYTELKLLIQIMKQVEQMTTMPEIIKTFFNNAHKASTVLGQGMGLLSKWYGVMLLMCGVAEVSDLSADALIPGQVLACEESNPITSYHFKHSWHGIFYTIFDGISCSTMFFWLLGSVIVVQSGFALLKAAEAFGYTGWDYNVPFLWNAGKESRALDPEDLERLKERMYLKKDFYSHLNELSDWSGMCMCERFFGEMLASVIPADDRVDSTDAAAMLSARQQGNKLRIGMFNIFRRVVLENIPSIFLTLWFVVITFDQQSRKGIAKFLASVLLSMFSSAYKAYCCWGARLFESNIGNDSKKISGGKFVSVLILVMLAFVCLNIVGLFACDTHMLLIARGFQCAPPVQLATNQTNATIIGIL